MTDAGGLDLRNIIPIGAGIAATIAAIYTARTYKHNKKSEQIKIAREEMDKISAKCQRLLDVKFESLANEVNGLATSQLKFLYHVEEVMKECRYFGYLVHRDVIKDDDIISYYKPEITTIFVEIIGAGKDAFKKMTEKRQVYKDLDKNIETHIKLVDEFVSYWSKTG